MSEQRQPESSASGRPWFVVEPPFDEGAPWINAGSPDPHGGEFVCDLAWPHETGPEDVARTEANAALIVKAVNEYDALRTIEKAISRERPGQPLSPEAELVICTAILLLSKIRGESRDA